MHQAYKINDSQFVCIVFLKFIKNVKKILIALEIILLNLVVIKLQKLIIIESEVILSYFTVDKANSIEYCFVFYT
jgi:hypothetical protein